MSSCHTLLTGKVWRNGQDGNNLDDKGTGKAIKSVFNHRVGKLGGKFRQISFLKSKFQRRSFA